MVSKGLEALELFYNYITNEAIDKAKYLGQAVDAIQYWQEKYYIIEKELNALEIIKNKKVNMFHIWAFDDYEQYKEHYPFAEYNAEEDMLAFEEFELLKEVLE